MTDITITLTNEQLQDIGAQIPDQQGGEIGEPPTEPQLMNKDFDQVWPGQELVKPVKQYPNANFACTDTDGYSIAIKLPETISKTFSLRMTDVLTPTSQYSRFVVFSTRRDFDTPYLKSGTGGNSAKCDLDITPDMAGATIYFNGTTTSGSPAAGYDVMLQGLSY